MFLDEILDLKGDFLGEFLDLGVFDSDMLVEYVSEFLLLDLKVILELLVLIFFYEKLEFIVVNDSAFLFFQFDDVVMEFFCLELKFINEFREGLDFDL
jgi:hypothetical protein